MTPAKLLWIAAAAFAIGVPSPGNAATDSGTAATDSGAAAPGPLRSFKDWVVGCDNLRSCVALGLSPEGQDNSYLRISRGGGAADEPAVSFSVLLDEAPKDPTLTVTFDSGPTLRPIKGAVDGSFVKASLSPQDVRSFVSALKSAKTLTLTLPGAASPFQVSLAGSAAALLFMDDNQGRVGGVTALAKPGPAPAAAVPPVPAAPVIAAATMQAIEPPPAPPQGVERSSEDECADADPIAVRLSVRQTLWGMCSYRAAYNFGYRMWLAGEGRPAKVDFTAPGETPDDPAELTNPSLAEDGSTLDSFAKGRGIGDCGEATSWAFDGSRFRLATLSRFEDCRGVPPEDWPVLFRAEVRAAAAR